MWVLRLVMLSNRAPGVRHSNSWSCAKPCAMARSASWLVRVIRLCPHTSGSPPVHMPTPRPCGTRLIGYWATSMEW